MVCSSALFYEYYKIMDVSIHMRLKDSLCMTLHIRWFPDSYVTLKDKYALVFDNIYIFFLSMAIISMKHCLSGLHPWVPSNGVSMATQVHM